MGKKILVVDDEEKIRLSLRGVLSDEGYAIAEAGDGRRALELLDEDMPDLVILDVWLPEVDGLTLLETVKGDHPDLPVIIICGHANIEAAVRATRLGAADFIEKPFSIDALLASITRALGEVPGQDAASPEWGGAVVSHDAELVLPQKTIARSVTASGVGLHTGASGRRGKRDPVSEHGEREVGTGTCRFRRFHRLRDDPFPEWIWRQDRRAPSGSPAKLRGHQFDGQDGRRGSRARRLGTRLL